MGFSLGGFINAAGQGLAGYEQGQIQRARDQMAMQRQIQQDALQRLLAQATVGHLNAESQALLHPKVAQHLLVADDGSAVLVGDNGTVTPLSAKGKASKPRDQTPWAQAGFPDAQSYLKYLHGEAVAKHIPGADQNTPHGEMLVGSDGQPYWFDYQTRSYSPFKGQGPSATPASGTLPPGGFAAATPETTSGAPLSFTKPGTPKAAGGKQPLTPEQARSLLGQLQQADSTMTAFENQVKQNPDMLGGATAFAAGASGAEHPSQVHTGSGFWGGVGALTQRAGNAALGRINPQYQSYLTAQNAFGDAAIRVPMGTGARYSTYRQQIETALSGLNRGDVAGTIDYRQQRRKEVMSALAALAQQEGDTQKDPAQLHKILFGGPALPSSSFGVQP